MNPYLMLSEDRAKEYDPAENAAAADSLILQKPKDGDGRAAVDELHTVDGDGVGTEPGMARLFLNAGRLDRIRPADIVGAIANEANLPGRAIGAIDIFDEFSFVEVPRDAVSRVLNALGRTTLRGKRLNAEIARPSSRQ